MYDTMLHTRKIMVHTKEEDKSEKSLLTALRNFLIIAQVLGQLPVMGISEKSLYFSWKTWKMFYWLFSMAATTFIIVIYLIKMILSGADLVVIGIFILNCNKLLTTMAFLYAAKHWPYLMHEWRKVEISMKSYGWPEGLERRIKAITIIGLSLATSLYIVQLACNVVLTFNCKPDNLTYSEYYYKVVSFPFVFSVINYSILASLFFQFVTFVNDITWCYVDIFIMIMSTALALRFKQITTRLCMIADSKNIGENTWKNLREDYNKLSKLCKTLDDTISFIVLMSFASNLFFILIQLFNSLRKIPNTLDKIYFFFAFGFLITRTVYVCLYAAWINDESRKPVSILNSVPSSVYNIEIRRFIQQLSFDSVALTGCNLFCVTRGLILSIAGAIVTYELVLIQFNENLLSQDVGNSTEGCPKSF